MGDDNEAGTSRTVAAWTFGLSLVSVVAVGVIVAGFLHSPEPELTTALPTTTPPTTEPERPEYSYVTPSVTYPTQIPGCDVVERPGESEWTAFVVDRDLGYDNPDYPWFSGPKAGAMSQALRATLPTGIDVAFASPDRSLIFQPIEGDGESEFGGNTNAGATVSRNGKRGSLSVSVEQSSDPVPACVAGYLDVRTTLADDTVVDVLDTWSETNGARTLSRSARAYVPDGTRVSAYSTDAAYRDDETNSGTVPLTVDELVSIVTAAGLRVTAPIPPGSVTPPQVLLVPGRGGLGRRDRPRHHREVRRRTRRSAPRRHHARPPARRTVAGRVRRRRRVPVDAGHDTGTGVDAGHRDRRRAGVAVDLGCTRTERHA